MNKLIDNIISYMNYLKNDCKLSVSIHFKQDIFDYLHKDIAALLSPYNCHTNAYCVMVKSGGHNKCLLNQKNILTKCHSNDAFCHVCYAGVYEYIYPICWKNVSVGFVSVSGYRQNDPAQSNVINLDLWKNLLEEKLPLKLCDAVIPPLGIMLESALQMYLRENGNEYNQILQFLNEYHTGITLGDLARLCNRSKSHISHLFKKESGMTLRAYCNNLKLEDAKKILLKTDISVTEVALNVGFNDTSYFIHLFKSSFGVTPLQYRQNYLMKKS